MTEKFTGPSHLKLSLILSNIVTFEHYRSTSAMMMMVVVMVMMITTTTTTMMMITEILRFKALKKFPKTVACLAHVECSVLASFIATNYETRQNGS